MYVIIQSKILCLPFSYTKLKIKVHKTVCETWSVTLREEHRLRVFENGVLRRIFGPKREEDGLCRKLHNDEIHSLYSSPNIIFFQPASTVLIGPWPSLMDFSIHRHLVGLLGWGISQTQGLYRNAGQHNTETRTHTSMPRAGFEPAISMFKLS
jgi:hypothetical protein